MNILYLTDTGNIIGGGEISLLNFLQNLDRGEFKPHLVMPQEGDFSKRIRELDIPVTILPLRRLRNPLNLRNSTQTIGKLKQIIQDNAIDLVHSNSTGGFAFLAGICARIKRIPFIWHVRMIESAGLLDLMQSLLSSKIIVISEAVKKRFWWMLFKRKIILIYNGVNLEKFNVSVDKSSLQAQKRRQEEKFLVGTLGRFVAFKGYEYLIQAATIVLKEFPHAKFLIKGLDYSKNNEYLQFLKQLTEYVELKDNIVFSGESREVAEFISSLDLFVFPSIGEPFGRVLIEAMASAKPVVAFRSGAAPEVVKDEKTGFLVKEKKYKPLAEKIILLLRDKELSHKMGIEGRLRAENVFDIKRHTRRIEALYRAVIKR